MYHRYACVHGIGGAVKMALFAIEDDGPRVHFVNAEEALHKGRFSGAVFTHKGMNRTGLYLETDIVQGQYTGELSGNPRHLKNIIAHYCSKKIVPESMPGKFPGMPSGI
jgi:hypothetical protein